MEQEKSLLLEKGPPLCDSHIMNQSTIEFTRPNRNYSVNFIDSLSSFILKAEC